MVKLNERIVFVSSRIFSFPFVDGIFDLSLFFLGKDLAGVVFNIHQYAIVLFERAINWLIVQVEVSVYPNVSILVNDVAAKLFNRVVLFFNLSWRSLALNHVLHIHEVFTLTKLYVLGQHKAANLINLVSRQHRLCILAVVEKRMAQWVKANLRPSWIFQEPQDICVDFAR